jgi:hypothetical protein
MKKVSLQKRSCGAMKPYETGLDSLLVSEGHETDLNQPEPETPIGSVLWYDPKNSEAIPLTKQFSLPTQTKTGKMLLESIEAVAKVALQNKSAPEHVHGLAKNILRSLHYWGDDLKDAIGKASPAWAAFCLGQLYERLLLWENEQPAKSGKRSRAAAQRKGRTAPKDSLRSVFESEPADWRNMSAGRLLLIAKKAFPNRSQESHTRQIRRLKKSGH